MNREGFHMKKFLQHYLAWSSKRILAKYRPVVICVSGSIGKTSTKEAVFAVLSQKYKARTNIKSYNNEFGLPFTIIGIGESPKRNPFKWIYVILKTWLMLLLPLGYPEALVLEIGIDHPGEMDALMDIVKARVTVLTTIGISHLINFESEQQLFFEESKVLKNNKPDDYAILNMDDPNVASLSSVLATHVITYGFHEKADVRIVEYRSSYLDYDDANIEDTLGTHFKLQYTSHTITAFLDHVIGVPHIVAAAAACASGIALGLNMETILHGLKNYKPQPGRLTLLQGQHNSIIIDDSYNAAPLSMNSALAEFKKFPGSRKIAVIGDMLELGAASIQAHKDLAGTVLASGAQYIVCVGKEIKVTADEIGNLGFPKDNLFYFPDAQSAITIVKSLVSEKSVVLMKASQGIRLEKITRHILANPDDAYRVLPRQDSTWLSR